jgi:hypothetical protein
VFAGIMVLNTQVPAKRRSWPVIQASEMAGVLYPGAGQNLGLPVDHQLSGPSFEDLVAEAPPHTRHANVLEDLKRRGLNIQRSGDHRNANR